MKERLVKKINLKQLEIGKLRSHLEYYKSKLRDLTYNEPDVEEYVITIADQMKIVKADIARLQGDLYELELILKG